MDETEISPKQQPPGTNVIDIHVSIPRWVWSVIWDEAKLKNETRSRVVSYLLICGLKAHIGEFVPPKDNTLRERYKRNGNSWF
jgi:hypothetical protein